MKVEYCHILYPAEKELQSVKVELIGKVVIVSQWGETDDRFSKEAEFVLCGVMLEIRVNYKEFIHNYIYVERLSTGVLRRVIFGKEADGVYDLSKFPRVEAKEVIDENQLSVLCMLHNVLLE